MAEEILIQRLVGELQSGVDDIHERGIESRRSAGRAVGRYNSLETSSKYFPSSTCSPVHPIPTNSERCAGSHASVGELSHPQNHSRQRNFARSSSDFTGTYELGDETKLLNGRTYLSTRSSYELSNSPSTINDSQGWETDTSCSSCLCDPYFADGYEPPTHHIKPIQNLNWSKLADRDYSPSPTDESENYHRSNSLPGHGKSKLRRVRRVDNLFLAANGVSKTSYQLDGTDSGDMN